MFIDFSTFSSPPRLFQPPRLLERCVYSMKGDERATRAENLPHKWPANDAHKHGLRTPNEVFLHRNPKTWVDNLGR